MASIIISGTLLDPSSNLAVGDEIMFTHKSTTGSTIESAQSSVVIGVSGAYSIELQYGLILVDYKDRASSQFKNLGVVTVNQDSTATSLPELLNAIVPPTDAQLLEFQAILADCVTEADRAETEADRSQDAADISEAFANQLTTTELISSTSVYAANVNIGTSGFLTSGDSGDGNWLQNGVTGQTVSQAPIDLGGTLLNDGNGNQWELVVNDATISILELGAIVSPNTGGVVTTAFDNGVLIQAANDRLGDDFGGGNVLLGSGTIGYSSTIYIGDKGPVFLIGTGSGVIQNSKVTFRESAGTRLQIVGGLNIDGVVITSDRANSGLASRQSGGGIIDVMLDGAEAGNIGLTVLSHSGSKLKVMLCYWTHIMFNSDVLSNGLAIGPDDVQRFDWSISTADVNTANEGLAHVVFNGNGGANTSLGVVSELSIICESSAVAAHFGDCDGTTFIHTQTGTRTAASGDGGKIFLHADDTLPPAVGVAAGSARSLNFLSMQATEGVTAKATIAGSDSSERNYIHGYSIGNGSPLPVVEAGAELNWVTDSGDVAVRGIISAIIGNNTNTITEALQRKGTESARIVNSSSNHVVLESGDGAFIWDVNIDGSSGDLRVTRTAGSGELLLSSELVVTDDGITTSNALINGFLDTARGFDRILAGEITATQTNMATDNENNDPSDDLVTINGGVDGRIIILSTTSGTRTTNVVSNAGNIRLDNVTTIPLTSGPRSRLMLQYDSRVSEWIQMAPESNA